MRTLTARLSRIAEASPCWAEFRYHRRCSQSIQVQNQFIKDIKSSSVAGVGIRVLTEGAWGFSSTSDATPAALEKTLKRAIECAQSISRHKRAAIRRLPAQGLAQGEFRLDGYAELEKMSIEEKLQVVLDAESRTRGKSSLIQSAASSYDEIFEDKIVVTSDGARAISQLARNEFRLSAVAGKNELKSEGLQAVGKTGPWKCLFNERSLEEMSEEAAKLAVDLLEAPPVPGGLATLILSPAMVGLFAHEAIGHTVEADFVLAGSISANKLGMRVGSPLITLCDSGRVGFSTNGGGDLLVDDEGILTGTTEIIRQGVLTSYLHNRESAAYFDVPPTGNGRAWLYTDEPLIRMRNTYFAPGETPLEEMIAQTEEGFLIDGPLGGQTDATGEFTFAAQKVIRIEKGKLTKLYRGATISGQAFDVLSTVDSVSREFKLDSGAGYCGKGQPAKIDAGGPFIRCRAIIGGMQE